MTATDSTLLFNSDNLSELQAKLSALPGSKTDNIYSNNLWEFTDSKNKNITIDFDDIKTSLNNFEHWKNSFGFDITSMSKQVWLSLAELTTTNRYSARFIGICRLLASMANSNLYRLTRDNISQLLEFMLTHHWHRGRLIKGVSINSYANYSESLPIKQMKWALSDAGANWIAPDITENFVKKQLKTLIPALTDNDLTYRDWFEGGSYNLLTLDYGRYYVEHCMNFFEENYALAVALSKTYRAIPEFSENLNYKIETVSPLVPKILQGFSMDDLVKVKKSWSKHTMERIHNHVLAYYKTAYCNARFESNLLKDSTLLKLVEKCGLPPKQENIDRMRIITWNHIRLEDKSETVRLLNECSKPVSWLIFEEQISKLKISSLGEPCKVPSPSDFQSIGLFEGDSVKDSSRCYPLQLIKLVESAGLTSVVALTGWRKSEFGFPISAFQRSKNKDILDSYAFPYRYQVDWYVQKTHGQNRQLREVTFSTHLLALRLMDLAGSSPDQPCLYSASPRKKDAFDSAIKIKEGVKGMWEHYVHHYPGFTEVDDWNSWKMLENIKSSSTRFNNEQIIERKRLLRIRSKKEWDEFEIDGNLKETWRKVRYEWPRLEFSSFGRSLRSKRNWLLDYRSGSLRDDWSELLDAYLSQETKNWINSLDDDDCKAPKVSKTIIGELLTDVLYPSPHAFRHMWAEAVYRRFDGDAGWMIRSQFKHISRSMWLAYIRDKDNRNAHQQVKDQVISSLVHNYLRRKGKGYSGQLHTWLRRLSKKTSIMTPDEQKQLADHLANIEIENIKANPWGYCLLKRRTRNKAKCAEMGEPMRHNASPNLCLCCIHNLMQTTNVEWAIFHTASHVDALKNPDVPNIFKSSSYELVKNVTRHVRTLNPQHDALEELQEALNYYKSSRAA